MSSVTRDHGSADAPFSARRAQTRQRLMTAASSVFAAKGVGGASVEEISEAAGFTRGAFYSNFESKDDLCFALLRSVSDSFLGAVRVAVAGMGSEPMDAAGLVETAVDVFLATQPADRESVLLLIEMELYAMRHPGFAEAYLAWREETHALFVEVIADALARQGVRLALPTEQVVEVLHAVHDGARVWSMLRPAAPDPLASTLKAVLTALMR